MKNKLEYTPFKGNIGSFLMSNILAEINNSKEIEFTNELKDGRMSHVVIKGTEIPIAYVGDEELELVNSSDKKLRKYHKIISDIYDKAENQIPKN